MIRAVDGPGVHGAISVSTTPVEVKVGASALSERTMVTIQPLDGDIYYGYDNSVSSSNGTKIFENQTEPFEAGDQLTIWVVAESGTVDVRITEVA